MNKRQILVVFLAIFLLLGFSTTLSAQKVYTVGFTVGHMGHSTHSRVWKSAVARGKELGINVIVMDDKEWDLGVESNNVDQLIARRVDGIMMMGPSAEGSAAAAKRATAAGIKVISLWDDVNDTPYVGSNFVNGGGADLMGKIVVDTLGGKGNLVYICGAASANIERIRDKGFREAIAPYPDIKIIYQNFSNWQRTGGTEHMEAALAKFPKKGSITAVVAHCDDMGLGALEAIRRAGRLNDPIPIFAIDGTPAYMQKLLSGEVTSTIYQNAELAGARGIEVMYLILAGKEIPNKAARPGGPWQVVVPWEVITTKNAPAWLATYDDKTGMFKLPESQKWDVKNMK
jgi:ribose transport system substrate-binding protein